MSDWEACWERDKYEVGRAMHEGWKRQKTANGFADHPYDNGDQARERGVPIGTCGALIEEHGGLRQCEQSREYHHADMIDWDALPPHQQAINFSGGMEGYRMGFEAGQRDAARKLGGVAGETYL